MPEEPVPLTPDLILRMQQQSSAPLKKLEENIWTDPDTTPPAEVLQVLTTSDTPLATSMLQAHQTAASKAHPTGVPEDPK